MMGAGMIGVVLFWVLAIVGIVLLVRWLAGSSRGTAPARIALDLLRERYARGGIDRSEVRAEEVGSSRLIT